MIITERMQQLAGVTLTEGRDPIVTGWKPKVSDIHIVVTSVGDLGRYGRHFSAQLFYDNKEGKEVMAGSVRDDDDRNAATKKARVLRKEIFPKVKDDIAPPVRADLKIKFPADYEALDRDRKNKAIIPKGSRGQIRSWSDEFDQIIVIDKEAEYGQSTYYVTKENSPL